MRIKLKSFKGFVCIWIAGAIVTWSLAQFHEIYSGRARGEGVTFEIHALERLPLYLLGWPVWCYLRAVRHAG